MTTLVNIARAVENFCGEWGGENLACELAAKLTCIEAEVLAELFEASGDERSAEEWIRAHALGDACGDAHCECLRCRFDSG